MLSFQPPPIKAHNNTPVAKNYHFNKRRQIATRKRRKINRGFDRDPDANRLTVYCLKYPDFSWCSEFYADGLHGVLRFVSMTE